MERRVALGLGLSAAFAAALAPSAFARPGRRWKIILDGHSLDGWTPIGDANWAVKDGAVQADAGKGGFLVSRDTYGDVRIEAEFWVSDDANSGIFIRCTNPARIGVDTAYEVNIFDRRPDPTYGTGAIVNVAKVSPMPKAGGRWNRMEITARGDRFSVAVNGVRTVDNVADAAHAHGRIALQYGAGVVKFRKVRVREI